jgi:hypothetical protein
MHNAPRLVICASIVVAACGSGMRTGLEPPETRGATSATLAQTCTAQTIRGTPVEGRLCGGSTHTFRPTSNCTPGVIYQCNNDPTNNCTLDQICATGCVTDPFLNDVCFNGASPFTLSATALPGGNEVTATVTVADAHPNGAIVNMMIGRGDLVAARVGCNIPDLPAGAASASFNMPTAVVPSPTDVLLYSLLAYTDRAGASRELVSRHQTLTLNPGGTAPPPPPLVSFTLTPSTIAPGGVSFMDVVLQKMAGTAGVQISATSSNPAVASVIAGGQPFVFGGCTTGGGAATLQAANTVSQTTVVTVSASSGAAGQAPLTRPLTVAAGCTPKSCVDLAPPACSGPDGCGGTLACGCPGGQTCGGGGTPGVCGTPATLSVASLALNPASVTGGSSSVGTVTLNMAAPSGGAGVFLSSSNAAATVPQSVVVPAGQTSASFTATTSAVSASTSATITASLGGSKTAVLTITPAGAACTPTTCAAQGKNCGTISNGCGGTLSCGACAAPQTCGGGGVANVCGGGTSATAQLTVTATGRPGESILSNPAGINVAVGTTGSASFATGTRITLTTRNGSDVIWSGACSSGGSDQATCTFTLTAPAAVTANVL